LASLCSFVVWVWLLFGDGYVSRRQMRRALNTWGNSASTASRNTGQALAADLVADFASPNATQKDRRALSKALVDSLTAGEIEIARLGPLFEKVNLPGGDDRSDGISASVEIYLALLEARLLAYQHLGRIPDSTFEWARCAYVLTQHKRHETAPADLDDLVEWAPYDLLNLIGLAHTLPFDSPNKIENPSTWEEERLYAVPETALEAGGVLRTRLGVKAKTD